MRFFNTPTNNPQKTSSSSSRQNDDKAICVANEFSLAFKNLYIVEYKEKLITKVSSYAISGGAQYSPNASQCV